VVKVNSTGTDLIYCGFIGGEEFDYAYGLDVDEHGCVYVSGYTSSDETTFPVRTGPDLTYNGSGWENDGFVAKLNADGTAHVYCGYIGGYYYDECKGIAVDPMGCAYVFGETDSIEESFPLKVGPDLTHNGGTDIFVVKDEAPGTDLAYCGYIGGIENDRAEDIAIDESDLH